MKRHHWNTGAKENNNCWTPNDQATDKTNPVPTNWNKSTSFMLDPSLSLMHNQGAIKEGSKAIINRDWVSMTEHADCRITFKLSLPRKSVGRLTDPPDMTIDVYCGQKTTTQQHSRPCSDCSKVPLLSNCKTMFNINIFSEKVTLPFSCLPSSIGVHF